MRSDRTTIRLVAMDVDGTLTDGTFAYGADGSETKTFHAHDGLVVKALDGLGIRTALISGRRGAGVERRATELRIDAVHLAVSDKAAKLREVAAALGIPLEETAFLGDDLSDIPPMHLAAWSGAPANAAPEVRDLVDFVAPRRGGHGAVRDILEHLLRQTGQWERVLERFQAVPNGEPKA